MTIYLDDYKTFNSKQELNYNVSMHEKAHTAQLTSTDRTVLRLIARYSVKYAGASHLKVNTIAGSVEKSYRTIGRCLKRLETLSIIRRIRMTRPKTGGKGASIMQIVPYMSSGDASMSDRMSDSEVTEKARQATARAAKHANEPLRKRQVPYDVLESVGTNVEGDSVRNNIPSVLYDMLSPFFYGKELRKYVGIVFRGKTSKVRLERNTEAFKACITDCIRRYKDGAVRGLEGYVYASVRRLSRRLYIGV